MVLQVDTDKLIAQCYVRFNIIRDLEDYKNILEKKILLSNMSKPKEIIGRYVQYESSRNYKSKDDSKSCRHGVMFEILLPNEPIEKNKLVKVVNKFTRFVMQEEKGIKFISYIDVKKNISYLNIVFLDREYYEQTKYQKYISTMYRNKNTKLACNKLDPLAEVVCKQGDKKKDKEGNPIIKTTYFKETKTRKFVYSNSGFDSFINKFKSFWTQALTSLKQKLEKSKFIKRLNLRKAWNRFERRVILANNWLIQHVQNELNALLQLTVRTANWHEISQGARPDELITDPYKYELITQVFSKYRKIFREGSYMYGEIEFKIQKLQCDEAERNLDLLRNIFEEDKALLLSKLN